MKLINDKKSYVRTRAFSLICAQSIWDEKDFIRDNLEEMCKILNVEKPITGRKALESLK